MNAEHLQEQEQNGRKFAQALLDCQRTPEEIWGCAILGLVIPGPACYIPNLNEARAEGLTNFHEAARYYRSPRVAFHAGVLAAIEEHEAR